MEYGLLVMGAPYASAAPHSALRFAKAVISSGHQVAGVFFYREGIHNASQLMTPPQDELNMREAWVALHQEHGVGRYLGLKHLVVDSIETEFLTLEYANSDKLYVPVSSLNLIGRYMGTQGDTAPLHRLGSDQWEKARKKALKRARDVAAELLDIHARRAAKPGRSMVVDSLLTDAFLQLMYS